jgi:hypothetical protein
LAIEPLEYRELLDATILPETSLAAPAIITFQDQVTDTYNPYIAWTGTDYHLNIENLTTGAKNTLPDTSSAAPALAVYQGRLFLGWSGTDDQHHLNIESSADGLNFDTKTVFDGTTTPFSATALFGTGPVLAVHLNDLAIAWTGTDQRLNYAYSSDVFGQYWFPVNTLSYQSNSRPALDTFNGDFLIAYTDLQNQINVYSLTYQTFEFVDTTPSIDAPSLTTDDGFPGAAHLGIAWTDLNNLTVYVSSDEFAQTAAVGSSIYAPSLVVDYLPDGNHYYVAWTDLDGYVNYDVL